MNAYNTMFEKLTKTQQTCCLASISADGFPKIRAMLMPCLIEGDTFYFHTNTPSQKVRQFRDNPKGGLYFFDPNTFEGLCFLGLVSICSDEKTRRRIWKDDYRIYYPNYDDFTVFTFTILEGDMYSNFAVECFTVNGLPAIP